MFGYLGKVEDKYSIIDTKDGVIEYLSLEDVKKALRIGITISGITVINNKIKFTLPNISSSVAPVNRFYTENNPFVMIFRFDFDKTLMSVCNINGEDYDISKLTSEDKDRIACDYEYLKSYKDFINHSGIFSQREKEHLLTLQGIIEPEYIDWVCEGFPLLDGKSYGFNEYFRLSTGEGFNHYTGTAPFSDDGLFQFDSVDMPCCTRILENGITTVDYR